ncbi:hypothetical protein Q1695_003854 [Nippostrongylus brasiliensis]|nr:hypothetical protein Q1695_003854 [Nippostrongylus brasiliensis]
MATQAAPKTRGGNNSTPGGTMTWASSRRLVITNDVPQIVVGGGSSSRGQERSAAAFPVPPAYSLRGATGQVSIRGGFQTTRGVSNATYAPRCPTTAQRGGTPCFSWRGSNTPVTGRGVPVPSFYRGTSVAQTRATLFPRNSVTPTVQIATVPTTSAPRSVTPDSSAPKFFPLGQTTLAPAPHFADTIPPATVTYPFQMRRMTTFVQPVTPRRDLRLSTPTPLAISKKTPIGVNLPSTDTVEESARVSEEVSERRDGIADESRNPEDSEDENEDGRTSPDVLSTSIRSNEDTWDFWDRVYSDPELRQSMQERQRDSPMAELLHSDKLCKAQVVFLNVPRLAYGQQHVVRSLIHREISSNLPILDIHITYRKWTVRFYRSEDAVQVLRHFNGFSFRNHKLLVRACQSNAAFGDATALEEAAQVENEERRATPGALPPDGAQRVDLDSLWTATEWKDIMDFKKDLITILEGKQTGMVLSEALAETGVSQRRGIVAAAAELWPTGLIRILLPEVKAIGRCVCLAGHEDMAALVRRAAQEGTPRLMTDSWEPIPPCEIRTEQHLLSYLAAFLSHFGPQHTIIDIPLRLLIKSLSGNWPATGPALAEWATKRSYQFIVMFEVLYLATSIRHRRILVEAVQPLSTLKFKFLNAANRC